MLLLLLSRFSRVRFYATPEMAAHQAPPVPGILQARTLECVAITGPITTWQIDGETVETVKDFILGGSKITADGDCSHEIIDAYSLEGKL